MKSMVNTRFLPKILYLHFSQQLVVYRSNNVENLHSSFHLQKPFNNIDYKTKVIPSNECIILTHNLLKLYISNLNQIHLQQIHLHIHLHSIRFIFRFISCKHCWRWIWFRFEIYSFNKLCVNIMHSLFGITFVLFLLKLSAGKGFWNIDYHFVYMSLLESPK
jgi:hypothetical protein